MTSALSRRAAVAVCITLSACAAAPGSMPGIGKGAYGAFLAARYADAQQDPATATVYYNRALQADPDNQNLINESFVAAILAGSPHAATLAPRIPGNALALMLLGNQAAQAGAFGKAAMYYGQLPQDNLAGLIRPLLLAWATMGQGRPQDAIASLAVPMSSGPFAPIYGLNAALIADLAQDNKDAASWYGQFGGQQPSLRLTQILSSWQARQGDVVGAQTMVEQLAQTHPDLTIALPAMLAQVKTPVITSAQNGLAEAYLTLAGSLDQPAQLLLRISFLRFALALRPDLSAARLILASVQAGGEAPANAPPPNPVQLQAALDTLQPIGPGDPLYGPAAMQEATLLEALNQPDQAVALLNKLAALLPANPVPLQAAGDVLRDNNQYAEAVTAYDKAITLTGQPPPPAAWSLYYDRGISEDQQGDWQHAEPDLVEAMSLSPNQPYVLNYLGYSWALRHENLDQAAAMLQQAVGLDPNEGAIIDSLGFVALRQGHTANAVSLLTQAVELSPNDADVNAHLGDAFWAAGRKLQADYQWQRALALKPDAKLQSELEGKLKQAAQQS